MSKIEPQIQILDLQPEIEAHWDELSAAIEGVIRGGRFILGPNVDAFEEEVAAYLGVEHAVGVNSATDALVIALRAMGIGPGDEVITTPFTFFATPESVANVGATPVFVDIDPVTFDLDPALIEAAVTERTKAIIPVHLYGQSCDMDAILAIAEQFDLKVVEDVAQAMGGSYRGRKLGALGDAAALSFFPSKNLGGFGDGGMVLTNDAEVARLSRMLRAHGSDGKRTNEMLGYNSRLDELQAAVLRVRLRFLDEMNDGRRRVAERYHVALAGVPGIQLPTEAPGVHHVYHQFTIRVLDRDRDELQRHLAECGVQTKVYYPVPCHLLPYGGVAPGPLPIAEAAAATVLSLPIGPSLGDADIKRVAEAFG